MRIFLSLICLFPAACANKTPRRVATTTSIEAAQYFFHHVREHGETLGIIAAWYTGSPSNWKALKDENKQVDGAKIKLGDTIAIPRRLVKTQVPLPKHFVASFYKGPPDKKEEHTSYPGITEQSIGGGSSNGTESNGTENGKAVANEEEESSTPSEIIPTASATNTPGTIMPTIAPTPSKTVLDETRDELLKNLLPQKK